MLRLALVLLCAAATLTAGPAFADSRHDESEPCVASDTRNVEPTSTAPDWYIPGVTQLCKPEVTDKSGEGDVLIPTAYWVYYENPPGYAKWRTTPDNADYSANDCENSYTTCGQKIMGDAPWFYDTCTNIYGLTAAEVAGNIRYWADRARANGPGWRVYTLTEGGGYPYRCEFSVVQLY